MRISDWSSDVCSSDLVAWHQQIAAGVQPQQYLEMPAALHQRRARHDVLAIQLELIIVQAGADAHRPTHRLGARAYFAGAGGCHAQAVDRKSTRLNSSH